MNNETQKVTSIQFSKVQTPDGLWNHWQWIAATEAGIIHGCPRCSLEACLQDALSYLEDVDGGKDL